MFIASLFTVARTGKLHKCPWTCEWINILFSSVQSLSGVQLFATPWTAARQASLSITNFRSSPKLMSIELVMPSNHLVLCRPLLLLPSVFPSTRVFSNASVLCIRRPKYWSFSFSISPSNKYSGLISFRMEWLRIVILVMVKSTSQDALNFENFSYSLINRIIQCVLLCHVLSLNSWIFKYT